MRAIATSAPRVRTLPANSFKRIFSFCCRWKRTTTWQAIYLCNCKPRGINNSNTITNNNNNSVGQLSFYCMNECANWHLSAAERVSVVAYRIQLATHHQPTLHLFFRRKNFKSFLMMMCFCFCLLYKCISISVFLTTFCCFAFTLLLLVQKSALVACCNAKASSLPLDCWFCCCSLTFCCYSMLHATSTVFAVASNIYGFVVVIVCCSIAVHVLQISAPISDWWWWGCRHSLLPLPLRLTRNRACGVAHTGSNHNKYHLTAMYIAYFVVVVVVEWWNGCVDNVIEWLTIAWYEIQFFTSCNMC